MEQEIIRLLAASPGTLFSAKEIGKRLDRRQYREDPNWARPVLEMLAQQKKIHRHQSGFYYYPEPEG